MRRTHLIAGLLALAAVTAQAQIPSDDPIEPPRGDAAAGVGLTGSVYDRAAPVAGARVELVLESGAQREAVTDERGRFRFSGLTPGRWNVAVRLESYLPSEGFVIVREGAPSLDIELRRIDERTPGFSEGNPQGTVRRWLESGNALLAEGHPAQARAEYEKALPLLDPKRRAEVLAVVARTFYLEQMTESAADALWQSIQLDPESVGARELYLGVMANLGRDQEAERKLEELDASASTDSEPQQMETPPEPPAAPGAGAPPALAVPEAPRRGRKGSYGVRFERRSDLGLIAEVQQRYGLPDEWVQQATDYAPQAESYSVFVPEEYSEGEQWGLLVWVSPTARGDVRRQENRELLAERRLIWIGANDAGNPRPLWERIGLALDAAQEMQRYYDLDPDRLYAGGYSGGGRMAAALAMLWPEVFRGGVSWFGTAWWAPVPVPYKPGHSWPAAFERPDRKSLSRLRKHTRLSLVTGDLDFNRSETRAVVELMHDEGIDGAAYFQIPDADHYFGVDAQWLSKALQHLDER